MKLFEKKKLSLDHSRLHCLKCPPPSRTPTSNTKREGQPSTQVGRQLPAVSDDRAVLRRLLSRCLQKVSVGRTNRSAGTEARPGTETVSKARIRVTRNVSVTQPQLMQATGNPSLGNQGRAARNCRHHPPSSKHFHPSHWDSVSQDSAATFWKPNAGNI